MVIVDLDVVFEIDRVDLLLRGAGEFRVARQYVAAVVGFAVLERDVELLERARDAADELLPREPAAAHAHLERWLGGKQEFFKA
jgi:ATP-dependent DNA helicase RecG